MTSPMRFVPPRVALTDPKTGVISREWYLFFQGVFLRIGGADSPSIPDIIEAVEADYSVSPTNEAAFAVEQALGQFMLPQQASQADLIVAELSSLRDQVAELTKELNSIKQGTQP